MSLHRNLARKKGIESWWEYSKGYRKNGWEYQQERKEELLNISASERIYSSMKDNQDSPKVTRII